LGQLSPQERAPEKRLCSWIAIGAAGSTAVADSDLAALEAAEELLPLLLGGAAVFLAGPRVPVAGDERAVPVDGFLGIDG
jgi:hypothetical protein